MLIRAITNKDKFEFTHLQDTTAISKANQEYAKTNGWDKKKNYRHLASIPTVDYYDMLQKYPGINHADPKIRDKELYQALRDPAFSKWKLRHE